MAKTYSVDSSFFDKVPGYQRAVLVAKGISNEARFADLESLLRSTINAVAADETLRDTHPKIQNWFKAYKQVGVKGEKSKVFPGVVGLLRRIGKGSGGKIEFISPLVALTNLVALQYMCPTGAFDLAKIQGAVELRAADGSEMYTAIKDKKTKPSKVGDIVLRDSEQKIVICNNWNSAGGLDTSVSESIKDVVFDIDMIIDPAHTDQSELLDAAARCADCLKKYCGAKEVSVYVLSKETPSFSFGAESSVCLPKTPRPGSGASLASTSTQWVQQDEKRTAMLPVSMAVSTATDAVAAVKASGCVLNENQEAGVLMELQNLLKVRLNMMQNHAYATGHSTVLDSKKIIGATMKPLVVEDSNGGKSKKGKSKPAKCKDGGAASTSMTPTSTQWVQQDEKRTAMLPVSMAVSTATDVVAAVKASGCVLNENQEAGVLMELQNLLKVRLNMMQNHAYATGHSTVLDSKKSIGATMKPLVVKDP